MAKATYEKSHVGLMTCWYCNQESSGLVMDMRLRETLPHPAVYDMTPCNKCKGYMQQGIILIGATAESINKIPQEQREYDERVAQLPYHQRNKAWPFVPNPYRTGHWFVVGEDFIKRNFNPPSLVAQILKCRWSFIDPQVGDQIKAAFDEQQRQQATGESSGEEQNGEADPSQEG